MTLRIFGRELVARRQWVGSAILIATVFVTAGLLVAWKVSTIRAADAAAASQPEPAELVTTAVAAQREHRESATSIGTVLALRSVALRNEVPGTVRYVNLTPGQIVAAGTVLVALDVAVEQAELQAQLARAALAETQLARAERLMQERATAQTSVDRARAEHSVAVAEIARTRAIIARKTIRAPFRARVGISDVHPGQYLQEGSVLTTLQGVEPDAHVDFAVAQRVAASLRRGDVVTVYGTNDVARLSAQVVAIDARIDPTTRNAMVRARVSGAGYTLTPGASLRVLVPHGPLRRAVTLPVSALRKGPGGDHVFVVVRGKDGKTRAQARPVESGPVLGDEVLILSGISAGERVAASGSFKLRDAALVAIAGDSASIATAAN